MSERLTARGLMHDMWYRIMYPTGLERIILLVGCEERFRVSGWECESHLAPHVDLSVRGLGFRV
jgi:hypothetical protein